MFLPLTGWFELSVVEDILKTETLSGGSFTIMTGTSMVLNTPESPPHKGWFRRPFLPGLISKVFSSNGKMSSVLVPSIPRIEGGILPSFNLKRFCFHELKTATRNFRVHGMIGDVRLRSVFKGWIDEHTFTATKPCNGLAIAVRFLTLNRERTLQSHDEWLTELNCLGQLRHENLVSLIGYCLEDDHRLLVYEFMHLGSLDNHLFRKASYIGTLSWRLRMKIAIGAAKGLAFLHSDKAKVIYRDFTTSKILLDSDYNAKLYDFSPAEDRPVDDGNDVSTRIIAPYGYAAPEYIATGHCTAQCDVYSFGVVLLELLSGRRAVDRNRPLEEQNLVKWAKPYLVMSKQKVFLILDSGMEGQYCWGGVLKAVDIVSQCLSIEPSSRPSMSQVVKALEKLEQFNDIEGSGKISQNDSRRKNRANSSRGFKSCRNTTLSVNLFKSKVGDYNTSTTNNQHGLQSP